MKKGTIVVEEQEDPFLRIYHLTEDISRKPRVTFEKPFNREKSFKEMEQVDGIGEVIIREIGCIAGVESITITPYNIMVRIGKAFLWGDEGDREKEKKGCSPSDIHFKILDILCRKVFFYPDGMMAMSALNQVNIVEGKDAESRLSGLRKK